MVFRVLVFISALLFAASAQAATAIADFEKTPNVNPITGGGILVTDGAGGFFVSPFPPFTASQGGVSGFQFTFDNQNIPGSDTGFVLQAGVGDFLFAASPLDVESVADTVSGEFTITALYQALGAASQPAFNTFFLEIKTTSTSNPLTTAFVFPETVDVTISAARAVNVIPLPATAWLLIAGVGGLAAMRRRR